MPRGRPSLGKAAKTRVASLRITEAEEKLLTERYGSATKGLRAILNANLKANPPPRPTAEQANPPTKG